MRNFVKNEQGATLIELIIIIMLLGSALPFLISLIGQVSINQAENEINMEIVRLATNRLEEIIAFKRENLNWFESISDFNGEETLSGGYSRNTQISYSSCWGSNCLKIYNVNVTVTPPKNSPVYSADLILARY